MYCGTANNCTFINNTAYDEGGAMKYRTANNCTFIGNDAMCGGGMSSGTANNVSSSKTPIVMLVKQCLKELQTTVHSYLSSHP